MRDWRDERIAELEAALAARDAQLAARDARIAELEQRVVELGARLPEFAQKLGQNSRNSHRPPSTDPLAARGQRRGKGKSKSQRKRRAQPGHRPAERGLLPPEEVDAVVNVFPSHCEDCAKPLPEVPDPNAMRFQVTELPPVEPYDRVSQTCSAVFVRTHDVRGPRPAARFATWPETDGSVALPWLEHTRAPWTESLGCTHTRMKSLEQHPLHCDPVDSNELLRLRHSTPQGVLFTQRAG
jgi:uncharacterized coiled-coil protein SlyX